MCQKRGNNPDPLQLSIEFNKKKWILKNKVFLEFWMENSQNSIPCIIVGNNAFRWERVKKHIH